MNEFQKIRKAAGVTQIEVAVRTHVSPPTVRNFERFGPTAVDDEGKRARLVAEYCSLSIHPVANHAA
jgi:transcriptional regulator with XRE-family HTH domain